MTLINTSGGPSGVRSAASAAVPADAPPGPAPLIGVTGRRYAGAWMYPHQAVLWEGAYIDTFTELYARSIRAAGGVTVFLPRESDPETLVQRLDGIVLSGGPDVDPSFYGGEVTSDMTVLDPGQDAFDLELTRAAIAQGVPVLGTCRGHEVLNIALGGTVYDHHLPGHEVRDQPAADPSHRVCFVGGSLAHELYGEEAKVNSMHHQAIGELATGLVVTGRSDDGLIEAVESPDHAVLGVQWHPEAHAAPDPAFQWLIQAARDRLAAVSAGVRTTERSMTHD